MLVICSTSKSDQSLTQSHPDLEDRVYGYVCEDRTSVIHNRTRIECKFQEVYHLNDAQYDYRLAQQKWELTCARAEYAKRELDRLYEKNRFLSGYITPIDKIHAYADLLKKCSKNLKSFVKSHHSYLTHFFEEYAQQQKWQKCGFIADLLIDAQENYNSMLNEAKRMKRNAEILLNRDG